MLFYLQHLAEKFLCTRILRISKQLGRGGLFGDLTAVHGHGTGDLLDWCLEQFPEEVEEEEESEVINVAIVGKPNVGKSSLLNRILGEERVIVSNIAGTTRDAIDSYFENETGKYCLIDTAGMRRKSKVDDLIEKYSNMRSVAAIERADVCLILIDANDGVTEQDTKIAGLVHEAGKAAIIVVNKWDAVADKETNTMRDKELAVRDGLSYMTYAPVVFLSALTGQRVDKLFQVIQDVHKQTGLSRNTISNLYNDKATRIDYDTVEKLCQLFKCSLDELFEICITADKNNAD